MFASMFLMLNIVGVLLFIIFTTMKIVLKERGGCILMAMTTMISWLKLRKVEFHTQKKTAAFQEIQFNVLPEEIVINILSYLPVQSLQLCKLVCVDWCNIINTKEFRRAHMIRAIQAQRNKILKLNRTVDYDVSYLVYNFYADNIHFVEHGFFHKAEAMNYNIRDLWEKNYVDVFGFESYDFVGSCNGLVLLCDFEYNIPICICNPITLQHMDLPSLKADILDSKLLSTLKEIKTEYMWRSSFQETRMEDIMLSGFGFTPMSRKYKVVRMYGVSVENYDGYNLHTKIWTVGTDEWREIGLAPSKTPSRSGLHLRGHYGIHVNGTLYWLFATRFCSGRHEIIALDLESEEFRKIALPPNLSIEEQCRSKLCNLVERLAFVRFTEDTIFIWHMITHQGQPRWNQIIIPNQIAPYSDNLIILDPIIQHLLVCCCIVFDVKGKPVPWHYFHALCHVEVLTSPSEAVEAIQEATFHDIDPMASIDLESFFGSSKLNMGRSIATTAP